MEGADPQQCARTQHIIPVSKIRGEVPAFSRARSEQTVAAHATDNIIRGRAWREPSLEP